MNDSSHPATPLSDIEAARLLLEKMGLSPADLLPASGPRPETPAFAEYIPRVAQAVSAGTRRAYSTYWNRVTGFSSFTELPAPLAQGSQWFTIASTPRAKTVIFKDHRKKLSALMIGRSSPLLCKCRMVLILKFGITNALSSG